MFQKKSSSEGNLKSAIKQTETAIAERLRLVREIEAVQQALVPAIEQVTIAKKDFSETMAGDVESSGDSYAPVQAAERHVRMLQARKEGLVSKLNEADSATIAAAETLDGARIGYFREKFAEWQKEYQAAAIDLQRVARRGLGLSIGFAESNSTVALHAILVPEPGNRLENWVSSMPRRFDPQVGHPVDDLLGDEDGRVGYDSALGVGELANKIRSVVRDIEAANRLKLTLGTSNVPVAAGR